MVYTVRFADRPPASSMRTPKPSLALPLALLLAACGEDPAVQGAAPQVAQARLRAAPGPPQIPWSDDPAVELAALALEEGDHDAARLQIAAIAPVPATELDRHLLIARLRAAEGDGIGAVAEIETARGRFGDQGRVFATAAELHAVAGRQESAEDELRAGLTVAGAAPALARARGVLWLTRPGGAERALDHLLEARAADPALPFCDWPLAQAHVLIGRRAMAEEQVLNALGHAQAALSARPGDRDALELLAEAQTSTGDYDGAIATYEGLLAAGESVLETLAVTCQRGSTAALLQGHRRLALERTLRARELGLSDEELGFGATLIVEEAERALDRGVALFAEGKLDPARAAFVQAVRCLPDSLEANNHLAVTLAALGDFGGAIEHWSAVVERARAEGLELPEPVHLRLRGALVAEGRAAEARAVLTDYLSERPDGRWADQTRALLAP